MKLDYYDMLSICRKLYGDNIHRISGIYEVKTPQGYRKRFRIYYKDKLLKCHNKIIVYSRFKIESKLGYKLPRNIDVHHKDNNTMNDTDNNLKKYSHGKHAGITHKNSCWSKDTRIKLEKAFLKRRMKMNSKIIKKFAS